MSEAPCRVVACGRDQFHGPNTSGAEMTVVGLGEAIITYAIGLLIAPALR